MTATGQMEMKMLDLKPPRLLELLALVNPKTLDHIRWWAKLNEYDGAGTALTTILAMGLSDHFDEDDAEDFEDEDILALAEAYADREQMTLRDAVNELLYDGLEGA